VDAQGDAYVNRLSESADFPLTPGAFQTATPTSAHRVFLSKVQAGRVGSRVFHIHDGLFGIFLPNHPLV